MSRKIKILLLVLVLSLLLGASLSAYTIRGFKRQASITVEGFLASMRAGKADPAFLNLPEGQRATLLEAFSTEILHPGSLVDIKLTSLRGAVATISLSLLDRQQETDLNLRRTETGWEIVGFPHIDVIQSAYLEAVGETAEGWYLYTLFHPNRQESFPAPVFFELKAGTVVDAVALQGELVYLQQLPAVDLEKLLTIQESALEDLALGDLDLDPGLILYRQVEDDVDLAHFKDLIPGRKSLRAYTRGDRVAALVLQEPFVPDRIRVLLSASGYQGTRHPEVKVTSGKAFKLEDKRTGETHPVAAGKTLTLKPGAAGVKALLPDETELDLSRRVHITGTDRLEIPSLERGAAGQTRAPAYRGDLEVSWHEGSLLVVNELPLEEYLYSVLPSEMPMFFGLEPLKAQAVAARSYAVTNILNSRFKGLGAHVDDSTRSQVYNNLPETALAVTAVTETTGLVPFFGSTIIDARFFSTSAGYTASFHQVWHNPETLEFPAEPVRYLTAASQLEGDDFDVSSEERIRDFLDRSDLMAYDSFAPFFRWIVTMTREELEASIEANLAERHAAEPGFILTKQGSQYVSMEIPPQPLGKLQNLRVVERGDGGNIMSLEVVGGNGTYLIRKQTHVRLLLKPVQYLPGEEPVLIHRHDGSVLKNQAGLPSAFIYFQINRDSDGAIVDVNIRGGGYGHGVGMSQYGALGMSLRGHDFREILSHFYPRTELWSIYAW